MERFGIKESPKHCCEEAHMFLQILARHKLLSQNSKGFSSHLIQANLAGVALLIFVIFIDSGISQHPKYMDLFTKL